MALIYEAASGLVTGILTDLGTGLGIQPSTLSVLIYDDATNTIILAESGLTPVSTYVDTGGNLTYYITPGNNPIVSANKEREIHVIRFTWTWTAQGATQTGKEELKFTVNNLTPN